MYKKEHRVTKDCFDEIKRFLETPITPPKTTPSIRYTAESFGFSPSVISKINRSKTYDEYRTLYSQKPKSYPDEWYFDERLRMEMDNE